MTTGQATSQATWLLTEPAPPAEAAAAPRAHDQDVGVVPRVDEFGGGEPGITWTVTGGAGLDWLFIIWSTSACTSSAAWSWVITSPPRPATSWHHPNGVKE